MRAVYVLCAGERGEGHSPVAVFSNREAALAEARVRWPSADDFVATDRPRTLMAYVRPGSVDQIWIYRFEVDLLLTPGPTNSSPPAASARADG